MKCPTIKELPPPPPDKTGWPWAEESTQLSDIMPDGSPWPKISIVTPSLNQGQFIEETIRSVLFQGYPDLEYIIIDGGSTDGTIEIIKKYEKWLAYWVSEPDKGQSHAINKGITKCNGDIFAWINSDDLYCKDAFAKISKVMWDHGKICNPIVYGHTYWVDEQGKTISKSISTKVTKNDFIRFWLKGKSISQPSVFLSVSSIKKYHLNEFLHYALDWDLWLRLSEKHEFLLLSEFLAHFRFYKNSKSGGGRKAFFEEQIIISKRYWGPNIFQYFSNCLSYNIFIVKQPFIRCWLVMKNIIFNLIGKRNYDNLKKLKDHFSK